MCAGCFNGAADNLGGSREFGRHLTNVELSASMGPLTISADQEQSTTFRIILDVGFNGAADNLGGSRQTRLCDRGRDRVRFNGAADNLGGSSFAILARVLLLVDGFNGAADNLGGSRIGRLSLYFPYIRLQWGRRQSRRIKVETLPTCTPTRAAGLQWGRRQSRRIKMRR